MMWRGTDYHPDDVATEGLLEQIALDFPSSQRAEQAQPHVEAACVTPSATTCDGGNTYSAGAKWDSPGETLRERVAEEIRQIVYAPGGGVRAAAGGVIPLVQAAIADALEQHPNSRVTDPSDSQKGWRSAAYLVRHMHLSDREAAQ